MSTINLSSVELVSTLRAAPQNGSPSSQDYNDSWSESLADLASLSGFINDIVIPLINGLNAAILPNPQGSPFGLEGRFILGDSTDVSSLFFDSLSGESLTLTESLKVLQGIVQTTQVSIQSLNVSVTALQSQLSSTNQNDIAQALQNFAATLQSLTAQVVSNTQQISNNTIKLQTDTVDNAQQNKLNLLSGSNIKLTPGAGTVSFDLGGVAIKTLDYTILPADGGTLIQLNSATARTFTLPAAPPSSTWFVVIKNIGTGLLTVSRNGLTIDNRSIDMTLIQGDAGWIFTDGSGYKTGMARPYDIGVFANGVGTNNQILVRFKVVRGAIFPAGAPNAQATASANATGSTTYSFKKNGSVFATAVFGAGSSTGTWTQASDAVFAPGNLFEVDGPATADATLSDVGLTLQGFKF